MADITKWEPGMDMSCLFVHEPEEKPENFNPNGGQAEVLGHVAKKVFETPDGLREFQRVTKVCQEYLGGDDPTACAQIDKLAGLVEPMVTGKPSEEEQKGFWSKIWRFIHYAGIKLRTIVAFLVYCFVFVKQLVGKFLKMLADLFSRLWDKLCTFGSWILSVLADVRHRVFG